MVNFWAEVGNAIEKSGRTEPEVQLLENDSQNKQSKLNDQIHVLLAKGVKGLAINLVDPAAAGLVIANAPWQPVRVAFFNKEPSTQAPDRLYQAF